MSNLCEDCEFFNLQSFREDRYAQRRYAYADVRQRVTACSFCSLLNDCFEPGLNADWIHLELLTSERKRVRTNVGSLGAMYIRVFLGSYPYFELGPSAFDTRNLNFPRGQWAMLQVCADEGSPAALSGDVLGSYNDRDLLQPENTLLDEWLSGCQSHISCLQTISGDKLNPYATAMPTRCLFVGTMAVPQLRLRETANIISAYLTLSHRWTFATGESSTTIANYSQRQISLDITTLPLVFQQAIILTRRMDVKYLWIDSLCIVQSGDDGRDWRSEATRMADYYQHSLVTFAATTSNGLFPTKPDPDKRLARLPYYRRNESRPQGYIYIQPLQHLNDQYRRDVQNSELLTRGWVFQEFLLSRRLIWFTASNILFECQAAPPVDRFNQTTVDERRDGAAAAPLVKQALDTVDSISWYDLIEAYSGLRFTNPLEDRTVALVGFAAEFGQAVATKDSGSRPEYIADLWSGQEHIGLLWEQAATTENVHERLPRHPSWSWVNLYSKVLWSNYVPGGGSIRQKEMSPAFESIKVYEAGQHGQDQARIVMTTHTQRVAVDRFLKPWELQFLFSTYCRPRPIENHYRAVRTGRKTNSLCGWASLEHESFAKGKAAVRGQASSADVPTVKLEVVHISTSERIFERPDKGYWFPWYRAFSVLFVRCKHDNVYERLGVGVLFGKEIDMAFRENGTREIVLV